MTDFPNGQETHDLAESLRDFATKVHHEPMESAMREAADMVELFAHRINHLTNVNDGMCETIAALRTFRKHKSWGAGEPDCPPEIKAPNGELHTLRCKACGLEMPGDDPRCFGATTAPQVSA